MRKFAFVASLMIAGAVGCGDVSVSVDRKQDQPAGAAVYDDASDQADDEQSGEGFSLQVPDFGVDVQGKDGKWDIKAPGTDVKVDKGKVDVKAPNTSVKVE